jgi:hypothetical protein
MHSRDLRHVRDPEELARAHALAERLSRRMRVRLARRARRARRGSTVDLRATIRRSVARGGEPLDLVFRKRRTAPLKVVLMLDVSGSMEPYTGFFVRFMHGVLTEFRRSEGFVFHTRLIHVSPALRERSIARAVDRLSLIAQGWSGGTRIGDCLAAFNLPIEQALAKARLPVRARGDDRAGVHRRRGADGDRIRGTGHPLRQRGELCRRTRGGPAGEGFDALAASYGVGMRDAVADAAVDLAVELVRIDSVNPALVDGAPGEAEAVDLLAPGASEADLLAAAAGRGDVVVAVAHQPDCGRIAAALTGSEPPFPPGGMVVIDLPQ